MPGINIHIEALTNLAAQTNAEGGQAWEVDVAARSAEDNAAFQALFDRSKEYASLLEMLMKARRELASLSPSDSGTRVCHSVVHHGRCLGLGLCALRRHTLDAGGVLRRGAAAIGIITMSAKKLTEKSVGQVRLLWVIYLLLAVVTVITESEIAWLFIAAGVPTWLLRAPPRWPSKGTLNGAALTQLPMAGSIFGTLDVSLPMQIGLFFAKAGAFVFGSSLAIVPFLYGGIVTEHQWLTERKSALRYLPVTA